MINLPPFPKNENPDWHGMTLDEIRMRRIVVQTRMEIEKYRMGAGIESARQGTPLLGSDGIVGRLARVFSIAEYAFMAFKLVRLISPVFRKKKR